MAENDPVREITSSRAPLVRAKLGSRRQFLEDNQVHIELSPGELFFDGLAEAIVNRLDHRLNCQPRLLEIEEAAHYLGLTVHALRHKAGIEIPVVRIDSKLRFDRRDLDRFIDQAKRDGV
jgi:hypothetical protein